MKKENKEAELDDVRPEEIEPKKSWLKDLLQTVLMLGLTVLFCLAFFRYVGQRVAVEGRSMNTTLQDQDQLIIDCFTYRFLHGPERYDIVVFRLKDDPKTYYIKRVLGLPGETIQIIDSKIYINGTVIDDPYAYLGGLDHFSAGAAADPITLGENEYFVMGDNRNDSIDSRFSVGPVNRSQLIGRAFFRILPFKKAGNIEPARAAE
ncbi:MAG: signal peptidase I [Lachnospiraceae bacterium]|nr:signal peptidase I [Lachnospiraceae bacterium]